MKYIQHITLDTGHVRRSPRDEVGGVALQVVGESLAAALAGGTGIPGMPGWSWKATAEGRCMIATVYHEGAPVLTFGVASHSRCGAMLWRLLHQPRGGVGTPYATAGRRCPPEPWLAVRMEIGAGSATPDDLIALADFERCAAWAWVERQ